VNFLRVALRISLTMLRLAICDSLSSTNNLGVGIDRQAPFVFAERGLTCNLATDRFLSQRC